MQRVVGGDIEPVPWVFDDEPAVYVNGEGKYTCEPNRALYASKEGERWDGTPIHEGDLLDIAYGPMLCVGFDPDTGESRGDIFVHVTGKLERGDRGNQVICSSVGSMELSDESNRPRVMEVFMAPKLLSYDRMEQLSGILGRYPGLDHVELLVSNANGETMRMELPTRVDGRNMVMAAEVRDLVGEEGSIQFA